MQRQYRRQLQEQQQEAPPAPPATEPTTPEPPADSAAPDTATPPAPPAHGGRVVSMPTRSIAEMKRASLERGERRARVKADKDAQELGYASHADMLAKLKARKERLAAKPPATPRAPATTTPEEPPAPRGSSKSARELQRAHDKVRAAHRARAAADRRNKELQRKYEAQQAENELRIVATRKGVKDTEYALHLLQKKLSTLSAKELETFDEEAYFGVELKRSAPYLFDTVIEPVTTSPDVTKPASKPATPPGGEGKPTVDARTLSKQDYAALLAKRGITPPSHGMPS